MTRIIVILISIPAVPLLAVMACVSTFFWVLFEGFQSVWRMGE